MIDLLTKNAFTGEQMFSAARFIGLVEFGAGFSPRPQLSHAVFDFDGTLSWLRPGGPGIVCRFFRECVPIGRGVAT